jgi:RNA polymerase sigma-70 factor, ECF subfamily
MNDDDRSLAARLKRRDSAAWEAFCRQYSGPLFSAIRLRFGCSAEMAEEIAHMAFCRSVRSIDTYDPGKGRLFDWLRAVAFNEAHTVLHKESAARPLDIDRRGRERIAAMEQALLPDELLSRQEFRSVVLEVLMHLGPRSRDVLILKYLEGRSVSEIAIAWGQTEKAVESLLTRSRTAMREGLVSRLDGQDSKMGVYVHE